MRSVIIGGLVNDPHAALWGEHEREGHDFSRAMKLSERRGFSRRGKLSSMESGFQCASCGEWNVTTVDESAGRRQSYIEDCQVCCKPNVLHIEYDNSSGEFFITSEFE